MAALADQSHGEGEALAAPAAEQSGAAAPAEGSVKLFVGQIPGHMDVAQLRPIFEPFGTITELVVLKDRATGMHRGCGFVVYNSATAANNAIAALHDQVNLGGGKKNLIVRHAQQQQAGAAAGGVAGAPAGAQPASWKLFVGMLAKTSDDARVRQIFEQFGPVEEVHMMRDPAGQLKGCAFVKFSSRDSAVQAIAALHEIFTDEGAPRPLNVKFADNQSSTSRRDAQAAQKGQLQMALNQQMQLGSLMGMQGFPMQYGAGMFQGMQGMQAMPAVQQAQQAQYGQYAQFPQAQQASMYGGMQQLGAGAAAAGYGRMQKEARGPPGANLFVYNIPESFGDGDLATLFGHFGGILSTRVFTDKTTGMPRGFGFVSYNTPQAAEQAIAAMNGFEVGGKRLKVTHKSDKGGPMPGGMGGMGGAVGGGALGGSPMGAGRGYSPY